MGRARLRPSRNRFPESGQIHGGATMRMTSLTACVGLLAALVVTASSVAQAAPTRYEAESSPAVCSGTIDSDWTGFSGSGFCNGTNATSGYAQFTVTASAA